ncbi:hypothetical protein GCK72_004484 [Caenorhabditis remanei]|uniref:F-box associated domain-containing protein n=1 Tax=Caenorhabditis remanei TaxID=31234 RepID=A0A6A5HBC4_CAERE|nr:hypothetical protein GCK72_004484 [Caenorhabditis remanei]KAF1764535.1 hypothetical protein GCK72_004484 [Caenorhabditis remanei]
MMQLLARCCVPFNTRNRRIQDEIVEGDNLIKIIQLAQYSQKTEKFVKERYWDFMAIEAKYGLNGRDSVIVKFKEKHFEFVLVETMERKSNGMINQRDRYICDYLVYNPSGGTRQLILYLMNLFSIPHLESVKFLDSQRDIRYFCNFNGIYKASRVFIGKENVTKAELDCIKDTFTYVDLMCFHTEPPKTYDLWPMNYRLVSLANKVKLSWRHLKEMGCQNLDLRRANLSGMELHNYIRYWLATDEPSNLESIFIRKFARYQHRHVLKGLPVFPWNPNSRSRFYKFFLDFSWDCSKGFDIIRRDGLLATIGCMENHCVFLVWKERFHEIPENYECYDAWTVKSFSMY